MKKNKAGLTPGAFRPRCQMMKREIPIKAYSVIQTGPKIQLGGLKGGFSKVSYQVGIAGLVARELINPTNWQRRMLAISLRISMLLTFSLT